MSIFSMSCLAVVRDTTRCRLLSSLASYLVLPPLPVTAFTAPSRSFLPNCSTQASYSSRACMSQEANTCYTLCGFEKVDTKRTRMLHITSITWPRCTQLQVRPVNHTYCCHAHMYINCTAALGPRHGQRICRSVADSVHTCPTPAACAVNWQPVCMAYTSMVFMTRHGSCYILTCTSARNLT